MESRPLIRGRIVRINGVPADEARIDPDVGWTLRRDRAMTYAAKMPEGTVVTEGKWWPEDYRGKPLLSLDQRIARGFGVGVGDTLTLSILGREIRARIASLRKISWGSLGLNHVIVLAPGALDGAPVTYLATAYAADETESALFRTVTRRFPNVVPVYIKDVLRDVGEILRKIGLAVKAMAWVTLATGLLVLVQALRANLRSRHYEAVIFKVVGATRRDIVLSLAAEFSIQGLATALLASLLGTLISYAFVEWVLRTPWIFLPVPLITIVAGGAGATLLLGLAGVRGVLGRKAWPVLRNE
jgi:putative ABC transport system permease protein